MREAAGELGVVPLVLVRASHRTVGGGAAGGAKGSRMLGSGKVLSGKLPYRRVACTGVAGPRVSGAGRAMWPFCLARGR